MILHEPWIFRIQNYHRFSFRYSVQMIDCSMIHSNFSGFHFRCSSLQQTLQIQIPNSQMQLVVLLPRLSYSEDGGIAMLWWRSRALSVNLKVLNRNKPWEELLVDQVLGLERLLSNSQWHFQSCSFYFPNRLSRICILDLIDHFQFRRMSIKVICPTLITLFSTI